MFAILSLVAVPTPVRAGVADLSYVIDVCKALAQKLRRDMLVVVESTVPPGATCGLVRSVLEEGSKLRVEKDLNRVR